MEEMLMTEHPIKQNGQFGENPITFGHLLHWLGIDEDTVLRGAES